MKIKDFGKTEGEIVDFVLPIADEYNVDLWDVRFEKEGTTWYLRVFIDSENGIDINKCEEVTRPINEILDKKDPIPQSYVLEVGSPGLERKLYRNYQFEWAIGMEVVINKIHTEKGEEKEVKGILESFTDKTITIDKQTYDFDNISFVKLYEEIEF